MNQIDPNVPQGTRALTQRPVSDLDLYVHTPPETALLSQVREGMRVVDVNGEELGKVESVQFGDPEAVTVSPIVLHDRIGLLASVFGGPEPHVAEPFFSHLLRVGFVKIDGQGWIDTDYYVTPDMVKSVSGNTVMLKAPKDRVITER